MKTHVELYLPGLWCNLGWYNGEDSRLLQLIIGENSSWGVTLLQLQVFKFIVSIGWG
jgi:hypothetical protein